MAFDTAGSLLMTKTKLPFNCKKMKCETILRLWKISPDYKRVSPQGEVKEVEPLGFGLDGKAFVAVNRKQGTVTSWSVEPFKENRAIKMGHRGEEPNESTLVAFSAESGLVALANPDFTVWDIRSGEKWSLPGHGDYWVPARQFNLDAKNFGVVGGLFLGWLLLWRGIRMMSRW